MKSFQFLILFSFFHLILSDGYICPGSIKLSPPNDLSQTVFWPSIWNDSMPPIRFGPQQNCQWQVEVPDGMYAIAKFYRDAPSAIGIWVEYSNGYTLGIDNKDPIPMWFTSPKFLVHLGKSSQQGSFSFKVNWFKYPNITQQTVKLSSGGYPQVGIPNGYLTTFTAETTVSLIGFSQNNISSNIQLLQSAIFDGESMKSTYLGSLRQVLTSGKPVISTGSSLSLYTFGLDSVIQDTIYMAQDHKNDKQPEFYHGWDCSEVSSDCPMTILSYSGPAAVATAQNDPLYIRSIDQFPDTSTLGVFEGGFDNQMANLTKSNYANQLPMKISGFVKQFLSNSGWITLQITKDADRANWHQVYDGRIIDVHSNNFGTESNDQNTKEYFQSVQNQYIYFNFNITDFDFSGSASLDVRVTKNGRTMYHDEFTSTNLPPAYNLKVNGDLISIEYSISDSPTKGFRMYLTTTRN